MRFSSPPPFSTPAMASSESCLGHRQRFPGSAKGMANPFSGHFFDFGQRADIDFLPGRQTRKSMFFGVLNWGCLASVSHLIYQQCPQKGARQFLPDLVSHHCGDPCRATQCRARSFAANPRNFKDVAGMSRYIPPRPPQKKDPVAPMMPLVTPLSLCRGEISLQKRIALHRGLAATPSVAKRDL